MHLGEQIISQPKVENLPLPVVARLDNVSMGYVAGQEVLKDVSLTIPRGSFHFLAGASGAGKSSLLNLLALSARPMRGNVEMFGQSTAELSREELPPLRRRVGMVYQDYRLLDHLTIEENVGLPLKVAGESRRVIAKKVTELLAWVGLGAFHKARPEILSGGQKQRVAIARAVVTRPDILLADEPSGNLDGALRLRFMHLFETLHKDGMTILLATHDETLISLFQHPVLRLKDGRLVR